MSAFSDPGALTCGLDYSPVNDNIYTFTAFNWLISLVLPLAVTVYFTARIFSWNRRGALYRAYCYSAAYSDDVGVAKIVLCTAYVGIASAGLQSGLQLAAGLGCQISGYGLFVSTVLLYMSWTVLPLCYWACCARSDCCYYWCCVGCCSCAVHGVDGDWPIGAVGQRKRGGGGGGVDDEVRGHPDPDVRTRLLTANRTYSDGSAVISERNSIRLSSNKEEETTL